MGTDTLRIGNAGGYWGDVWVPKNMVVCADQA